MKTIVKMCKSCGKEFVGLPPRKFCSMACSADVLRKPELIKICEHCQIAFTIKDNPTGAKQRFCSKTCAKFLQRKMPIVKTCHNCDRDFYSRKNEQRFCSKRCARKFFHTNKLFPQPGDEKILRNNGTDDVHVCCRSGNEIKWRRKAVVLLEALLGQTISRREAANIIFLNGDRLDVRPQNLGFKNKRWGKDYVCKNCGQVKTVAANSPERKSGLCRECYQNQENTQIRYQYFAGHNKSCCKTFVYWNKISALKALIDSERGFAPKFGLHKMAFRSVYQTSDTILGKWFQIPSRAVNHIRAERLHKGIRPMAKKLVWKVLLKQHDELVKKSRLTLYERACLLAKVYEDPAFLADCRKTGERPYDVLSEKLGDTPVNFPTLYQIWREFPTREAWENQTVESMNRAVQEKLTAAQKGQKAKAAGKAKAKVRNGRHSRKTATLAEVSAMELKIEKAKSEADHLRDQLAEKAKRIESLEFSLQMSQKALDTAQETIQSLNKVIAMMGRREEEALSG